MACGFGSQKAGNQHNVEPDVVHLPGPSANKSLYERLCLPGTGCSVMTAKSGMDFSQEIPPLLFGDAPLKDSGCAFLIKLSLVDFIGFRSPHYVAGLVLVLGKFLPS